MADSERLAQYVQSLAGFVVYDTIDGNYDHIGATVADAVLQANNKYKTHVKPRVNRILSQYPAARTTTAMIQLLKTITAKEFLSWRGEDRVERFCRILDLFHIEGVEDEADLRDWLNHDSNLSKLGSIRGIGPKTVDYFKILVGLSTSAIDRHLRNFLALAGLAPRDYHAAQVVINETADLLSIDRAYFDHSIWQYMSKGKAESQSEENQSKKCALGKMQPKGGQ